MKNLGGSMFVDMPYFMENEEWYYFDFVERKYKLTEKAPQKAIESYKKYYETFENEKVNTYK